MLRGLGQFVVDVEFVPLVNEILDPDVTYPVAPDALRVIF